MHDFSFGALFFYTFVAFGLCWGVGGSVLTLPLRRWISGFYTAGVLKCDCGIEQAIGAQHVTAPLPECKMCGKANMWKQEPVEGYLPRFSFWLNLLECPACLGFWVGLIAGALDSIRLELGPGYIILSAVALAFYTAGVNYVLGRITGLISEA